jgi:hypothetical protein
MTDFDDLSASDDVAPAERLALPSLDSFAAVNNLVALAIDPRAVKRHLRQLHDSLAAIADAQRQLDAREAAVAAREEAAAEQEKENTAKALKLHEQEVEFATRKDARLEAIIERELAIMALERKWRFIGEDDDAMAGLDDIAEQMAEKFPAGRTVRSDPQGAEFPAHTSLSRSEPEPEAAAGAQVAGVRARYRRRANHVE